MSTQTENAASRERGPLRGGVRWYAGGAPSAGAWGADGAATLRRRHGGGRRRRRHGFGRPRLSCRRSGHPRVSTSRWSTSLWQAWRSPSWRRKWRHPSERRERRRDNKGGGGGCSGGDEMRDWGVRIWERAERSQDGGDGIRT
jgi:hypothetical protein